MQVQVDRTSLLRAHYTFQNGRYITELSPRGPGVLIFSAITPIPMWNHSSWEEGSEPEFRAFLESVREWLGAHNRCPVVYLVENNTSEVRLLQEKGFERFDEEAWMVMDVRSAPVPAHDEHAKEVRTEDEFSEFAKAFNAAYQVREQNYIPALQLQTGSEIKQTHYVLTEGNSVVSVGTLTRKGDLGCIYNLGTPPPSRKQGYASRLLRHLLAEARDQGCSIVFLQAENNSSPHHLYCKLGFQEVFLRSGWRLRDWAPLTIKPSRLSTLLGCAREGELSSTLVLRESRPIEQDLFRELTNFARAEQVRIETLFSAAWACLVHRYSGSESISFSCSSKGAPPNKVTVGIARETAVSDWLRSLENPAELSADGEADEVGLFVLENSPTHFSQQRFPLELYFVNGQAPTLEIVYRSNLFSKDVVRRMATHLLTLLQSLLDQRSGRVGDLEILDPREKHQLLVEWTEQSFVPSDRTIQQLFEAQVEKTPDAVALVFARNAVSGPAEQMTYRQLNRRANKLAHRLKKLGVGPEVFVGLCLDRSLEMIVSLLAVLKAGGACVPLDPAYPAERIAFMLSDTKAPVAITHGNAAAILRGSRVQLLPLDSPEEDFGLESDKNPNPSSTPQNAAYVIYTSGSTGQPKGVVIENHAIASHALDCKQHYGINPHDKVLQFSSFNFDAAFEQIFPALISGAGLVVRDSEIWSLQEFATKLRDLQITVADIPTAYWHELAEEWAKSPENIPNHALRLVIVGGEALSPQKLGLWQQTSMNKVRLINAYGPTETTITATSFEVPPRGDGDSAPIILPIGRPRGDRTAYVLDPIGNPVPIGVPGELHIGGTLLARGYHNRPDLTADRFIPNPFSDDPQARLYKTGDLVRYLSDGNLEFLGRLDDQVKIRGFRIELGEVEAALRKHPHVREVLVIARADHQGEKRLIAYLTPNSHSLHPPELREFLKARLPGYMVPHHFVVLEQWPLMPNGKIDRRALPDPVEEVPEQASVLGPRDPLELQLQLIFERVLKRAPIGVDVSFFELGGDSLQALELLVQIERATGKHLPLGTLYQSSTVETLAAEVREKSHDDEWSSLVSLHSAGSRPPFFLLHTTPGDILGYGNLVFRMSQDQPCYGFQSIGLKAADLSHTEVERMAAYYVELLQKFQPHGPYFLGGWCYGGILAVEMARILTERGEEIGLLALMETIAMPPDLRNWRYYAHRLQCLFGMSPRRWATYVAAKVRYARDSRLANRMRFRQALGDPNIDLHQVDPRLATLEHVYNTNLEALRRYRSSYYDGKVTLFNAAEEDPALIPDEKYGWVGLAREIEIHEVPGNHDTMLSEPNVAVLAEKLDRCLRAAQEQFQTKPSRNDKRRS